MQVSNDNKRKFDGKRTFNNSSRSNNNYRNTNNRYNNRQQQKNTKAQEQGSSSPSLSHPPGFTPAASENVQASGVSPINRVNIGIQKEVNAKVMNSSQDLPAASDSDA
ncbi:hypothetical protein Tco_0588331 [Tanacetum coccineum]